jgi:hypothetical protein
VRFSRCTKSLFRVQSLWERRVLLLGFPRDMKDGVTVKLVK